MFTTRKATLERYARYCGPAVLAAALNISRMEAAKRLQARGNKGVGTDWRLMQAELEAAGKKVTRESKKETLRAENPHIYINPIAHLPTLSDWIRQNHNVTAIVATATHWVYVNNGEVMEDNGFPNKRGRVNDILRIDG